MDNDKGLIVRREYLLLPSYLDLEGKRKKEGRAQQRNNVATREIEIKKTRAIFAKGHERE